MKIEKNHSEPSSQARSLVVFAHASLLVCWLVGPLVVAFGPGRRDPHVRAHALSALEFQFSTFVLMIAVGAIALFVEPFFFLYVIVMVSAAALAVRACVRSYQGQDAGYPAVTHVIRHFN